MILFENSCATWCKCFCSWCISYFKRDFMYVFFLFFCPIIEIHNINYLMILNLLIVLVGDEVSILSDPTNSLLKGEKIESNTSIKFKLLANGILKMVRYYYS